MNESIAAVVVTYNRLALLKNCLQAIKSQTRKPDIILVINNGSTDGTSQWLDEQVDLTTIHQENVGGAGGFCRGIKEAFEKGYDWIWVMDDDGIPHQDCLQNLLIAVRERQTWYASPNLVDFEGISHFDHLFDNSPSDIIHFIGGPFNGVLLKKELVAEIGYPNSSFYIWGDEYEYTDRIIEKGLGVITVKNAIHQHKRNEFKTEACPRSYYYVRNKFWRYRASTGNYINRKYLMYGAIDLSVRLFSKGLLHFNFKQVKEVVRGVYDGIRKNYSYTIFVFHSMFALAHLTT